MPETQQPTSWNFVAEGSVENQLHTAAAQTVYYGWEGSVTEYPYKSLPWLGAVVDVSGHYNNSSATMSGNAVNTDLSRYVLTGGPEVTWHRHGVRPFARFQLGMARHSYAETVNGTVSPTSTSTGFAMSSGGGADVRISPVIALRVQCDWMGSWASSLSRADFIRSSAGVVMHF